MKPLRDFRAEARDEARDEAETPPYLRARRRRTTRNMARRDPDPKPETDRVRALRAFFERRAQDCLHPSPDGELVREALEALRDEDASEGVNHSWLARALDVPTDAAKRVVDVLRESGAVVVATRKGTNGNLIHRISLARRGA